MSATHKRKLSSSSNDPMKGKERTPSSSLSVLSDNFDEDEEPETVLQMHLDDDDEDDEVPLNKSNIADMCPVDEQPAAATPTVATLMDRHCEDYIKDRLERCQDAIINLAVLSSAMIFKFLVADGNGIFALDDNNFLRKTSRFGSSLRDMFLDKYIDLGKNQCSS
ncbi:uncharacterized protein EHS24_005469 [Apiotrichum porosum]|uniref:Uncharacterized protein n=1 Tax=Apiotrichum porosum TaxID=105984 RepID=A0A427XCY6_9TREE|nr:uncharacterized protein EHS24_005469 [Apiotrichum porosum]RSH76584.1 hypothetical protein EHS24_005469 [Apiotrichum porosum]